MIPHFLKFVNICVFVLSLFPTKKAFFYVSVSNCTEKEIAPTTVGAIGF